MAKNLVKHSPKALNFYRKQIMLSESLLAKKSGITEAKIILAHSQDTVFTFNQIKKLAKVLLIADFLLLTDTLHTVDIPPMIDYRNNIDSNDEEIQYQLNTAIRELVSNRDDLLYTYECAEVTPRPFDLELQYDDAEKDAHRIRSWLQVKNSTFTVQSNDDYYRTWRTLIEAKDVLVIELPRIKIASEGMALFYDTLPIINILTSGQTPSRRLFTMIHELVHLGLRQSSIDGHLLSATEELEKYCNRVAGHVLLPREVAEQIYDSNYSVKENVEKIRKTIKVSKQAIAIQLYLLQYITQVELNTYLQQLATYNKTANFGLKAVHKSANQFGKVYIQQILSAVWNERISVTSAMNILKLKDCNDLAVLEQKVFS